MPRIEPRGAQEAWLALSLAIWSFLLGTVVGAWAQSPPSHGPLFPNGEHIEDIETLLTHVSLRTPAFALAFRPDGEILAVGGTDGTIQLWDVRTGTLRRRFETLKAAIVSIVFSPDSHWLAAASDYGIVRLWDLDDGTEPLKLTGWALAFHPDSRRLAAGSADGTLDVWDLETGERLSSERVHKNRVAGVAWSADGKILATGSWDRTLRLLNGEDGTVRYLHGHENRITSVAWSADSRYLASSSLDGTVRIWNAKGDEIRRYDGHTDAVLGVTWSPVGPILASASSDTTVRVWDLFKPTEIFQFNRHTDPVFAVAFNPDGRRLASSSEDNKVRVWTLAHGREIHELDGHASRVSAMAFDNQENHLAIGSWTGEFRVWSLRDETGRSPPTGPWQRRQDDQRLSALALNPDGTVLAAGLSGGIIEMWHLDTAQDKPFDRQSAHTGEVSALAFSPDGRILASGSEDETIRLWEWEKNKYFRELSLPDLGVVRSVAFSPDGRTLASGSEDRNVRLWDWETSSVIDRVRVRQDVALHIAFQSERRLILALRNDTIQLWDRSVGILRQLHRFPDCTATAVVGSSGRLLASACLESGLVRVEAQRQDGTYHLDALLLGGKRGTWIDCRRSSERCWRYDDGTLLVRESAHGDLEPVRPEVGSAQMQLVSAPAILEVLDGEMVTFTIKVLNQGPGRAFWIRLQKVGGSGDRQLVFYPPPARVTLDPGEEVSFPCSVSVLADYADPESADLLLALEALPSSGEPLAIPPIKLSSSGPSLEWRKARLSFDRSRILVTLANTGALPLTLNHFEISDLAGDALNFDKVQGIQPRNQVTLDFELVDSWRKNRLDVTVYKSRPPMHQWRFSDRKVDRSLVSIESLSLAIVILVLALAISFVRRLTIRRKGSYFYGKLSGLCLAAGGWPLTARYLGPPIGILILVAVIYLFRPQGAVERMEFEGIPFVKIPAGVFIMGSAGYSVPPEEKPPHPVELRSFWLEQYEVTNAEFRRYSPDHSGDSDLPVTNVNWFDAKSFCERLGFQLPTEAQWEYAARGGMQTRWSFGDNESDLDAFAWYSKNSYHIVHGVGRKRPNPFGLYDIHGNAWEWVKDRYGVYSETDGGDDPVKKFPAPENSWYHVLRGGSASDPAFFLRSANRWMYSPIESTSYIGFRCAMVDDQG